MVCEHLHISALMSRGSDFLVCRRVEIASYHYSGAESKCCFKNTNRDPHLDSLFVCMCMYGA